MIISIKLNQQCNKNSYMHVKSKINYSEVQEDLSKDSITSLNLFLQVSNGICNYSEVAYF